MFKRSFDSIAPSSLTDRDVLRRGDYDLTKREKIIEMGNVCQKVERLFRNKNWTVYAREYHPLVNHNFGNGLEPAVRCCGCRRLLPTVLITGDHVSPKSNKERLQEKIAEGKDGFNLDLYRTVLNMSSATFRSDTAFLEAINLIKKYDLELENDLRNIQPLCWYCNTRKGSRLGVKLYPEHATLPIRPNEAPF